MSCGKYVNLNVKTYCRRLLCTFIVKTYRKIKFKKEIIVFIHWQTTFSLILQTVKPLSRNPVGNLTDMYAFD